MSCKCPSIVTLSHRFLDRRFKDKIYLIIWCCVAYNHLRNQYFNDQVEYFTSLIKKIKPENYQDFKKLIYFSNMSQYGKRCINEGTFFSYPIFILDDDFWSKIFLYIKKYIKNSIQLELNLFPEEFLEIRTPDEHIKA